MPDQDGPFGDLMATTPPRVLMSLNPEYYDLMWARQKFHEFRRRYLTGPTTCFFYLTAPESRLAPVIDLDAGIAGSPEKLARIAEVARQGNGQSVYDYLARPPAGGVALPIRRVREYRPGFTLAELADRIAGFHPPQGYTLIDNNPQLSAIADELLASEIEREMTVDSAALAIDGEG